MENKASQFKLEIRHGELHLLTGYNRPISLALALRIIKHERGCTTKALSDFIGVPERTISGWLSGRKASADGLIKFSRLIQ